MINIGSEKRSSADRTPASAAVTGGVAAAFLEYLAMPRSRGAEPRQRGERDAEGGPEYDMPGEGNEPKTLDQLEVDLHRIGIRRKEMVQTKKVNEIDCGDMQRHRSARPTEPAFRDERRDRPDERQGDKQHEDLLPIADRRRLADSRRIRGILQHRKYRNRPAQYQGNQ